MSLSLSAMERSSPEDYLTFLDFPHAHDPTHVSDVAALSTNLLRQLPTDVHESLWQLQESTSVVYASYVRLLGLLDERSDRLSLLPNSAGYSECAFANYVNQFTAERRYLLEDAYSDWKHKVAIIRLDQHLDLTFKFKGQKITVRDWLSKLQETVIEWSQEARAAEVPDFDETVSEYTSQTTTPTSIASSNSLTKQLGVSSSLPKTTGTIVKHSGGSEGIKQAMERYHDRVAHGVM